MRDVAFIYSIEGCRFEETILFTFRFLMHPQGRAMHQKGGIKHPGGSIMHPQGRIVRYTQRGVLCKPKRADCGKNLVVAALVLVLLLCVRCCVHVCFRMFSLIKTGNR